MFNKQNISQAGCRYPQLASAVDFLGSLLSNHSDDGVTSPGGVPVDMELLTASKTNPDGSYNNSCLIEQDAIYQVCAIGYTCKMVNSSIDGQVDCQQIRRNYSAVSWVGICSLAQDSHTVPVFDKPAVCIC